jgi:hypothetical protein
MGRQAGRKYMDEVVLLEIVKAKCAMMTELRTGRFR